MEANEMEAEIIRCIRVGLGADEVQFYTRDDAAVHWTQHARVTARKHAN